MAPSRTAPTLQPLDRVSRLEGVAELVIWSPLILIEAPSSTYHRGMLVVGKVLKKRRRPHAILHQATPILLRHRPACPHHVPLYPESGRRGYAAPEYESQSRHLAQVHCALSGRYGHRCRMYLYVVLARRPVCAGRAAFCPGPRPVYEGDPWGQDQKRQD